MVKSQVRIAMSIDQILRQSIGYREDFSITHLANIRPSHVTSSDGKVHGGTERGDVRVASAKSVTNQQGLLRLPARRAPVSVRRIVSDLNRKQYMTEIPQAHRPYGGFLYWPLGQYLCWSGDQFVL